MTRQEFIRKLQEALNGKLDAATIQDHLKFYDDYIIEEMRKGKSEQEVLELLGDPWAIAKTIVDASDGTDEEVVYENRSPFNNSYNQTTQAQNSYTGYGQKDEYGTVEEGFADPCSCICSRSSCVCYNRNYQFSGTGSCSSSDHYDRDQTDWWEPTILEKRKVKDRWGSHRSFEGSINN